MDIDLLLKIALFCVLSGIYIVGIAVLWTM